METPAKPIGEDQAEPEAVQAGEDGNPAEGSFVQVLAPDGPDLILRVFTVKPGGHTPRHSHAREHEVYILSGRTLPRANRGLISPPGTPSACRLARKASASPA